MGRESGKGHAAAQNPFQKAGELSGGARERKARVTEWAMQERETSWAMRPWRSASSKGGAL